MNNFYPGQLIYLHPENEIMFLIAIDTRTESEQAQYPYFVLSSHLIDWMTLNEKDSVVF